MRSGNFEATTRQLIFWLPAFMGVIEYILRVGFGQPGKEEFFPISLVASGISLNVAATALPAEIGAVCQERFRQAVFIANMGIFASLGGLLLWIYLLVASFNERVRGILPLHPLLESLVYYIFTVAVTMRKARVVKC